MSVQQLSFTIKGTAPLLMNNPQMVDPFNLIAKEVKVITKKGPRRTDEDFRMHRALEMEAKIYWDSEVGIYVPIRWMAASLAKISYARTKISKGAFRGAVFIDGERMKLSYRGEKSVKGAADVHANPDFQHLMLLPQGPIRVAKVTPIFHDWSFSGSLEYENEIIDRATLVSLIQYAARYGGYGDFRPTFGRGVATVK